MMRLYIFCCLIFSGMLPVQGQVFEWANGWGWSDAATFNAAGGISITTDDLGNSYVTGGFSGTVDFDPGTGTYFASTEVDGPNNGIYISKLDTDGSFLWVKTITDNDFGTLASSIITTDAWNNIYIAGSFEDTIDIDPGPGVVTLYPHINTGTLFPDVNAYVLKLNSTGDFLWARAFTGTAASIRSSGLQTDGKGNVFVIGTFGKGNIDCDPGPGIDTLSCVTEPGDNGYLVKLDTAGNYYWCYGFGGANPWDRGTPYGIKTDCDGNIVIAGAYGGTVDFGNGEPQSTDGTKIYGFSPYDSDLFVLKIDEDGNFIWVKTAGGPNIDIPYNITLDDLSNIITTGRLRSDSMDFDPGPDVHMVFKHTAPAYASDLFVWKLDEDGNFNWVKHFGREDALVSLLGRSLTTDVENNIYVTGTFSDTTDFDPGTGVFNLYAPSTLSAGMPSGLLLKLTDSGNLAWAYNTGTGMYPYGLNTDFLGNILITGSYRSSTADFDPGAGIFTLPHPNIGDAAFVLKLSCASCRFTDRNTHHLPYCSFKDTMMLSALESYDVYTWDDGSTGQTRTIDGGGTYWVRGKGCNRYLADTFILYPVEIQADLGPDTTICNENYYELATGTRDASFLWSDGSEAESLGVNSSGRYWVSVQKQGCEISDTVQVTIKDLRRELGPDHIFCKGDAIQVTLSAAIPDGTVLLWNTGEATEHITVRDTSLYFFTLTDAPCSFSDSASIAIDPFCDCAFLMPTAFSPNGDGINDLFGPVIENGCPASRYSLNIFNRFGQRVFSSTDREKGWDGLQNGTPVDVGTYFYELRFHSGTKQKEHYRKGNVTLVR